MIDAFTDELQDAARARTTFSVLSENSGILNAAGSDEHVQKLRRGCPERLLQELQRCCDHIVIPVLRVVQGQLVHLQTQFWKFSQSYASNTLKNIQLISLPVAAVQVWAVRQPPSSWHQSFPSNWSCWLAAEGEALGSGGLAVSPELGDWDAPHPLEPTNLEAEKKMNVFVLHSVA